MKEKIIDVEGHCLFRMIERGVKCGLGYEETKRRAFETVRRSGASKRKHRSRRNKTYYAYFEDNLSFYVICKEKEYEKYKKVVIKTVIIEQGRE